MLENLFYFIIIFYIITPLVVRTKQRIPEIYKLHPLTLEEFSLKIDDTYKAKDEHIRKSGCIYCTSAYFSTMKTETIFSIYHHPTYSFTISLVSILNPNVPPLLYMEVSQLFDDNTILNLTNSPLIGAFPKSPRKKTFHYPEINDIDTLIEKTNLIVNHYLTSKKPVTITQGEELKEIEYLMNEELREVMDKGYIERTSTNGVRMLTFKGTYLMTWKMMWPFKQLFTYKERYFSQQILKEVA